MIAKIFSFFVLIASVSASCDNLCSGHGSCLSDDVCACYDNWGIGLTHDSGDCSDRICPYEIAWVDHPNKEGRFHKYAECAGRGICDRTVGECVCFDGYDGKGCGRTACPNDCSGHGTCEYQDDMHFAATWNDYTNQRFSDDGMTFAYTQWDRTKVRGCVCDATYGDFDCSKRLCPYGTDVLDTRNDLLISTKYQVQTITFLPLNDTVNPDIHLQDKLQDKTFALTFKTKLNETFTTIPIVFDPEDMTDFVHDIQTALLSLPNRVIDGVSVYGGGSPSLRGNFNISVTFTGAAVQGPQHLLIVEDYECSTGCTPKITGLPLESRYFHQTSNTTETQLADYNSYECGRRGKCDYTTGLCACFSGYTGENCNTLSTLV